MTRMAPEDATTPPPHHTGTQPPDGWEYTIADYVRIEEESELVKHEFDHGQIRAMSGGTIRHAALAGRLSYLLQVALDVRSCAVYPSDLRIRAGGLITYPDLSVGCGESQTDGDDPLALRNPCVIVEITSQSSERYDRGKKRLLYQQLESLGEYVIVSHREHAVEVFARAADGTWTDARRYAAGERAVLPSLGIELDVDEIYRIPGGSSGAS
jgi:Uma2 family endonuclease